MNIEELEQYEEITSVSFDHEGAHLASTHMLQGGASNGWNQALILKSDQVDDKLVKALEQIQVNISFEEFLVVFFHMYHDDAEVLAKILGFETEEEYKNRIESQGMQAPDRWGTEESWEEYQKRNLEYKTNKVTVLKQARDNGFDSLNTDEKIELLEFQYEVEKAIEYFGGIEKAKEMFTNTLEQSGASEDLSDDDNSKLGIAKAEDKSEGVVSSANDNINTNLDKGKGEMSDTNIEKSAEQIQLEKMADQVAALEKALETAKTDAIEKAAKLEALEKAEEARMVAGAEKLVKSFGFVAEENQAQLVEFLVKSVEAPFVTDVLKQAQAAVEAAKAEIEDVKKSFGEVEVGVDGETTEAVVKSGQEAVDKSLASFAETLKAFADK